MTPAEYIKKAKYDEYGSKIWSQDGQELQMLADVRGWGHIQNLFKENGQINEAKAAKFQDSIGQFIVDAINEKIERESNIQELKKFIKT